MKKVLCLTGGGVNGLVSLQVLKKIEDKYGAPLNTIFDLITGTSTGSIIAGGISCGISTQDMIEMYLDLCPRVFKRTFFSKLTNLLLLFRPKYPNDLLVEIMEKYYGFNLSELDNKFMSTAFDITNSKVKIFKSWRKEDQDNYSLADTILASTATPTYLPQYKNFIDGGIYSNNPSLIAGLEALKLWPDENIELVSVGTGYELNSYDTTKWGSFHWIISGSNRPIIDAFMVSNMDLVSYTCKNLMPDQLSFTHYDINLRDYFKTAPLDKADPDHLKKLQKIGNLIKI